MKPLIRTVLGTLVVAGTFALTGCGGSDGTSGPIGTLPGLAGSGGTTGGTTGGTGGTGTTTPPPTTGTTPTPTLTLTLTNASGAATTSVPATARATVRDAAGATVPNVVVTFSTDPALGALVPSSGTSLTDSGGVATVAVNAASLTAAGAATLTANSQVGSAPVSGSIGYSVGATAVTITTPTFGTNPLSAFGTTSVSVTVNSNGVPVTAPQTVSFASPCASSGKAVLTASVLTGAGGVATASYRDNGCGGTDLVTASVSGLANASSTLTVTAPTTGSIQFVSATPASITLKGTGGAGRQESAQVIFKVVDTGGNPIGGNTVSFSLSTSVGGITFANGLTTSSAISDATTGQAVVTVNAGTISTPVRVLASIVTGGVTLSTQSDQLTITTGIPDQDSFSLSATTLNIEGFDFDGITTVLTARLADHFSNPVPDGTSVNFIAEGGSIVSSCSTVGGACSATMTSQELRPRNGRVTVLAYAVGEESFTDLDGDGWADLSPDEMIDANGDSTDMGEAFVDYNENGIRDANEPFIDFNVNGSFDDVPPPASKQYNGTLCNTPPAGTSSAGTCAATKSIHVRRNLAIVFSGSDAAVRFTNTGGTTIGSVNLPACNTTAAFTATPVSILVTITDNNGNIMPAGTTVVITTKNGEITSEPVNFVVANSAVCLDGAGPTGFTCPGSGAPPVRPAVPLGNSLLTYRVSLKSDATQTGAPGSFVCTDTISQGDLTVTVTTPRGVRTIRSIPVFD